LLMTNSNKTISLATINNDASTLTELASHTFLADIAMRTATTANPLPDFSAHFPGTSKFNYGQMATPACPLLRHNDLTKTDLHLAQGTNTCVDYLNTSGTTLDIDGQTRDITPDVGADERR